MPGLQLKNFGWELHSHYYVLCNAEVSISRDNLLEKTTENNNKVTSLKKSFFLVV